MRLKSTFCRESILSATLFRMNFELNTQFNLRVVKRQHSSPVSIDPSLAECVKRNIQINLHGAKKTVLIFEAGKVGQENLVNIALESSIGPSYLEDPYGVVLWPAAVGVTNYLLGEDLEKEKVVELGCGTGLVSLALALYGNPSSVLATDYNPLTLQLIRKSWEDQRKADCAEVLSFSLFDVSNHDIPLPAATLYIFADVLYSKSLGISIAQRIAEAVSKGSRVIVGDSIERLGKKHMLAELKEKFSHINFTSKRVAAQTMTGYRHNLISDSSTHLPEPLDITLFEFSPMVP